MFTDKYVSPKVYDELEEVTGYSRKAIQEFKTVADRTSTVRTEDLSFNHHKEVAPLEPEQQKQLLDKASEEITGYDRGTLKHMKSVSEKVPTSARSNEVSFSHHVEVAPLEPEQQKKFLQKFKSVAEHTSGLRNQDFKSVSEKTSSSRNEDLTFKHHKVIAPFFVWSIEKNYYL